MPPNQWSLNRVRNQSQLGIPTKLMKQMEIVLPSFEKKLRYIKKASESAMIRSLFCFFPKKSTFS